ncbi:lipoprotein LpqH [Mariniluteicoccus flavus]
MNPRCLALPLVSLLALPSLGCSLIAGGEGSFTADGDVYKVSKVECERTGESVRITAESGPAGAMLLVKGTTVEDFRMGSKEKPTMAAQPGKGLGEATVTVEDKRFRAKGKLVKIDEQGNAQQGPGTEDVEFDVTCGSIKG